MKTIRDSIITLSCENVLECFYGINESDVEIYRILLTEGEKKIEEISLIAGKSENTTYKSLQKLMLAGIVIREKRLIRGGGYYYTYKAVSPDDVADEMKRTLDSWYKRVVETIEEFRRKYGGG